MNLKLIATAIVGLALGLGLARWLAPEPGPTAPPPAAQVAATDDRPEPAAETDALRAEAARWKATAAALEQKLAAGTGAPKARDATRPAERQTESAAATATDGGDPGALTRNLKYMPPRAYRPYRAYRVYKQGDETQQGSEKDCAKFPFDRVCRGTAVYCKREPMSVECVGTELNCERFPSTTSCLGTEAFCAKTPRHDSCAGTAAWCLLHKGSAGCAGMKQVCEEAPGSEACYGTAAFCASSPEVLLCLPDETN